MISQGPRCRTVFHLWRHLSVLIGASLLGACVITEPPLGQEEEAEGPSRPAARYHTVVRGDTLYGIAFRYGQDYRVLARRNGIRAPYRIYPGRRLVLGPRNVVEVARPRAATGPPRKWPAVRAHRERAVTRKQAMATAPRAAPARVPGDPPCPASGPADGRAQRPARRPCPRRPRRRRRPLVRLSWTEAPGKELPALRTAPSPTPS